MSPCLVSSYSGNFNGGFKIGLLFLMVWVLITAALSEGGGRDTAAAAEIDRGFSMTVKCSVF